VFKRVVEEPAEPSIFFQKMAQKMDCFVAALLAMTGRAVTGSPLYFELKSCFCFNLQMVSWKCVQPFRVLGKTVLFLESFTA
jgi:hypothetical protein